MGIGANICTKNTALGVLVYTDIYGSHKTLYYQTHGQALLRISSFCQKTETLVQLAGRGERMIKQGR